MNIYHKFIVFIAILALLLTCATSTGSFALTEYKTPQENYNRALQHLKYNEYTSAIYWLDRAIELDPNYADAYASRAHCYYERELKDNDYDMALADASKAVELNTKDYMAYTIKAEWCYDNEYDEQAAALLTTAIRLNPGLAGLYVRRAQAYYYLKEYNKAWKDVNSARKLNGLVPTDLLNKLRKATGRTK